MERLQRLRELVDDAHERTTEDDSFELNKQISTLKTVCLKSISNQNLPCDIIQLCSQRSSALDELVIQHDKDMDMIQQEHDEEVKALTQEKYKLQQKLQEADLKWNHYITQQTLQVTVATA